MNIRKAFTNRFRQLRWKLTLNYTIVTVTALVIVEIILLLASGTYLVNLLDSSYMPILVVQAVKTEFVPVLRVYLEVSPLDQEATTLWLERFSTSSVLLQSEGTTPIVLDPGELKMVIVKPDGSVPGSSSPGLTPMDLIGTPVAQEDEPVLLALIGSALAGEEDPAELFKYINAGEKLAFAIPILDSAEEELLGVLVMSTDVPTLQSVLGNQLPLIGVSLLVFTLFSAIIGTLVGSIAARGLVRRLDKIADASLSWRHGDFNTLVDDHENDELGQLSGRLNGMAQQLDALLDTRRELAIVEERNRLARELHDSTKQQAFAAAAQLDAARTLIKKDPAAADTRIAEAERLVFNLRQELTNLIQELRPVGLEDKGLAGAVREYAEDWSRQTGIAFGIRIRAEHRLSLKSERSIFRILQEALANVARHSQASRVEIELLTSKNEVICSISDNGTGFEPSEVPSGVGLNSMQERANLLNASLKIDSSPGQGTKISIIVSSGEVSENGKDFDYE